MRGEEWIVEWFTAHERAIFVYGGIWIAAVVLGIVGARAMYRDAEHDNLPGLSGATSDAANRDAKPEQRTGSQGQTQRKIGSFHVTVAIDAEPEQRTVPQGPEAWVRRLDIGIGIAAGVLAAVVLLGGLVMAPMAMAKAFDLLRNPVLWTAGGLAAFLPGRLGKFPRLELDHPFLSFLMYFGGLAAVMYGSLGVIYALVVLVSVG
jgi:hypothetical protein